jgi:hypothetical protein
MDRRDRVRVDASDPLLRRGLQRAARRSGVVLTDDGDDAVEVLAAADAVTIVLRRPPASETWASLHRLVLELWDDAEKA